MEVPLLLSFKYSASNKSMLKISPPFLLDNLALEKILPIKSSAFLCEELPNSILMLIDRWIQAVQVSIVELDRNGAITDGLVY